MKKMTTNPPSLSVQIFRTCFLELTFVWAALATGAALLGFLMWAWVLSFQTTPMDWSGF
jgi:hypothetical protein